MPDIEPTEETINACARLVFVTAWADAEEGAGRTYPGQDLYDVAPNETPAPFTSWAQDAARACFEQASKTPGMLEEWADLTDPEDLGRAIALTCGGMDDGFGAIGASRPVSLPSMDCDARLYFDLEDPQDQESEEA